MRTGVLPWPVRTNGVAAAILGTVAETEEGMKRWIEDCILTFIQKRCDHPGSMVAVDILEGSGKDIEVAYCRRCGGVQVIHGSKLVQDDKWRIPCPHLWRG